MISMIWKSNAICLVLLLCASCAASQQVATSPPVAKPLVVPAPGVNERPEDTSCSYGYFLRAKMAEAAGRLEEAREGHEKALVCDRQALYVMRSLAVLLVRLGYSGEAVAWLDKIRARQPDDVEVTAFLANLHASLERPAEAIALYQEILRLDPDNLQIALLLGTLHARNQQPDEARALLRQLVQSVPDSYLGQLHLGKLYQELNELPEALARYRKALGLHWSEGLAFEIAELSEFLGRYQEAAAMYHEILGQDDTNERARGGLAGVYLQFGSLDMALAELEKLREYAADTQKVDFTIGQLLLQQERYEEASRKFTALLAGNQELDTVRYLLAYIRYEQKNLQAARELIQSIPDHAPVYEDATLLLVKVLEEGGDQAAVEGLLRDRLAGEATRRPVFYLALAAFYQDRNQPEREKETYAQALGHYPEDPLVRFQYGMYLERQERSEEAMEQMQKVLLLEPANPYALNYVGYTWADQGINLQEALKYIQEAVALRPEDGFIRDSLGWVHFRLGDLDQALVELLKAIELEPDDPHIHEHLGDVYVESLKPEAARDAYQRALEIIDREDRREEIRRKMEAIQL